MLAPNSPDRWISVRGSAESCYRVSDDGVGIWTASKALSWVPAVRSRSHAWSGVVLIHAASSVRCRNPFTGIRRKILSTQSPASQSESYYQFARWHARPGWAR